MSISRGAPGSAEPSALGGFLDQKDYRGANIRVRLDAPVLSRISCSFEQTSSTDDSKPRRLNLVVN